MQLSPIVINPGVYDEASEFAAKGRWTDCDKIRFWKEFPERIGGWSKLTASVLDTPARSVHIWQALDGTSWIAWGTQNKLWVFDVANETLNDITPAGLPAGDGSAETSVGPWGDSASGWGDIFWGGAAPALSQGANARTWSLDNFGEDLVANYFGGPIYLWDKSVGTGTVAAVLSGAPSTAHGIFVSDDDRHLVAIGAHDGTSSDGMNIAWSDAESATTWTPTVSNSAGSKRVQVGSELISLTETRNGTFLLTDSAAYIMRFIGQPFVFSIDRVGVNCGASGPNCAVDVNGVVHWMSRDQFFTYDGSVRRLPCDILKRIFEGANTAELFKVYAGVNSRFEEAWFFYPGSEGVENSKYAIYNYSSRLWAPGTLERTSWVSKSGSLNFPVATDANGNIYLHESSDNGDGSAIAYSLESAEIDQVNGQSFTHIRMLVPDFKTITGDHQVEIRVRDYPARTQRTKGPYSFNSSTDKISVRARGRSFQLCLSSSNTNNTFRMGLWRAKVTPHGERA